MYNPILPNASNPPNPHPFSSKHFQSSRNIKISGFGSSSEIWLLHLSRNNPQKYRIHRIEYLRNAFSPSTFRGHCSQLQSHFRRFLKDLKTLKNSGIRISVLPLIKPEPTLLKHLTSSRNNFSTVASTRTCKTTNKDMSHS